MGTSSEYTSVPEWVLKDTGYQTGAMVRYKNNIFRADFWAGAAPGEKPKPAEGWALYDELYDLTAQPLGGPAKVIAYIPTWRKQENFAYGNDVMFRNITHGIVAFLQFSETQPGAFEQDSLSAVRAVLPEVIAAGRRNATKIMVAIGGATDFGFQALMTSVADNPTSSVLAQAVQNVVSFVQSNQLDGVDLDLECWWDKGGDPTKDQGGRMKQDGPHPAGKALALFAGQLKRAMPDKIVSATVFATSWYGNNYDPSMAAEVDWLGVMTYDLTGSWNDSPVGPHSALTRIRTPEQYTSEQHGTWPGKGPMDNPILSVEESLWYWTNPFYTNWQGTGQRVQRNKIVLGVPTYGYDFAYGKEPDELTHEVPPGYKTLRYSEILAQFPDAHAASDGHIKIAGVSSAPPFLASTAPYPFAHNIYFETPAMAISKLEFAMRVGTQGVLVWELSNDVWDDARSITRALYARSGDSKAQSLPVQSGNMRYNQIAYLCTHNSFVNYSDLWPAPSQSFSIGDQLDRGVRALMLDTHYAEPGPNDIFHIITEPGVYLLHGVNEHGWIAGSTYSAKIRRRLYDALNEVISFLRSHPQEIVTVFLEDYTTTPQLTSELGRVGDLKDFLYDPDNDVTLGARATGAWPLVSEMIKQNKRLMILSSVDHDNITSKHGVAYDRAYTRQNYWSLGDLGNDRDCRSRWNDGNYLAGDTLAPPLFVMNHYRNTPTTISAAIDNAYDNLMDRIDNHCYSPPSGHRGPQQWPNFVAVDFFELPLGGATFRVIAELNERFAKGSA